MLSAGAVPGLRGAEARAAVSCSAHAQLSFLAEAPVQVAMVVGREREGCKPANRFPEPSEM